MDLRVLTGVLWRSRLMVLFGVLAALLLAVLAMAKPGFREGKPQIVYRQHVLWQSGVTLLVTQVGFPEGRTVYQTSPLTTPSGATILPTFADPSRFADLAVLYAQLAMSDTVQRTILSDTLRADPTSPAAVVAEPVPSPSGVGFLPLLRLNGISSSPTKARLIAEHASAVFERFLEKRQAASGTPAKQRVELVRLNAPAKPTVFQGRKSIRAIFAFFLIVMLTIAAAFIRDNFRGRKVVVIVPEERSPLLRAASIGDGGNQEALPRAAEAGKAPAP